MARKPIDQPGVPYVEIIIGDFDLMPIPPEHFISLSHTRSGVGYANELELEVYDRTAIEVNAHLAMSMGQEGLPEIRYRYGWYNEPERDSPEYVGMISDWDLTFDQKGAELTLNGISRLAESRASNEAKEYSDKLIHEIVIEVAESMGYTADVDRTINRYKKRTAITEEEINEEGETIAKYSTEDKMDFIRRLAKMAIPHKEDIDDPLAQNFRVTVDDENDKIYFKHLGDYGKPSRVYTFEWNTRDSDIISWNPTSVEFLLGLTSNAYPDSSAEDMGVQRMASFPEMLYPDRDTGLMRAIRAAEEPYDTEVERSSYSAPDLKRYLKIVDLSSEYEEVAKARMSNLSAVASHLRYEATAEILGDGSIKLWGYEDYEDLEFHIYLPDGTLHFTSGIYKVLEITDEISDGSFTTNLTMIRESVTDEQEEVRAKRHGYEETDEKEGLIDWDRETVGEAYWHRDWEGPLIEPFEFE